MKLQISHNKLPIPSNEEDSVKHQKLFTASLNLQKTAIFPVKLPFSLLNPFPSSFQEDIDVV